MFMMLWEIIPFFQWSLVGLGIYYARASVDQASMQESIYPKQGEWSRTVVHAASTK